MPAERWSEDKLEAMRDVGDPSADKAVGVVMEQGGLGSINRLLRDIVENDDLVPASLPPALRRYWVSTAKLPTWADPAQLAAGQELFCRLGPQVVLALHCAALPVCYAGAKGANALYLTHGMTTFVHRRIIETAQILPSVYGLRGHTFSTLFGLIAMTGLRVSEALALNCEDVDLDLGVLTVRCDKGGNAFPATPDPVGVAAGFADRALNLLHEWQRESIGAGSPAAGTPNANAEVIVVGGGN